MRIQLGYLYVESGHADRAAREFRAALAAAAPLQNRYSANAARLGLAEAQLAQGDTAGAQASLRAAAAGFHADRDDESDALLLLLEGQALAREGRHAQALERYRRAQPLIERDGNLRYQALLYRARAASAQALGRLPQALADYQRYMELQAALQARMRLEQSRLLEQENEIHRRDLENQRLRAEAALRLAELDAARRVRRWQALALVSAGLLLALLAALAWRQRARSRALARLALQDPLTGVANRAALEATATEWLAAARREQQPLSVLLLDLDHFKAINDRHGHAAGDTVLRACAAAWQAQLRSSDLLARTGGEEFCVLCAQADAEAAAAVAAPLLEATRALRLPQVDPALQVRVSIGIAQWERGESLATLLDRADAALYRAKQRGRDRCER